MKHPDAHTLAITLGRVLREHRLRLGLTQAELADRLGVGQNRVCNTECGRHLPALPTLVDYCDVFGRTVSDLLKEVC